MSQLETIAQVMQVVPLTDSILKVILSPQDYIDYAAGQYLKIKCHEEWLCYSIANAPFGPHYYELHIRHAENNPYYQQLLTHIKEQRALTISLPHGECQINRLYPDKPILFIAGGTGFAPIKAMIEHLLATGDRRQFELYWGARSQSDLYMDEKVKQWQTHVDHFRYVALLSGGKEQSLAETVHAHHASDLLQYQVVLGGPFDMVYAVRDALVAFGMAKEQLFSDAFN